MDISVRKLKLLLSATLSLFLALGISVAQAAPIWETSVTGDDLKSSRSSLLLNGLQGTEQWENNFKISWDITFDSEENKWTYDYTLNAPEKDIAHFILEVTQDEQPFTFTVTSSSSGHAIDGPRTWSNGNGSSNPGLPNPFYGIKFDLTSNVTEFNLVFVTDRSPVWGNFYAKDGRNRNNGTSNDVVVWNTGLNFSDYKSNQSLTKMDFIARPNSINGGQPPGQIPEPSALVLLSIGLLGVGLARRRQRIQ